MVGVPVHNYRMLPIQKDLGTFITKDTDLLEKIQRQWDLELTFDDNCDYHYSLKFYQDGNLVRTLSLNLHCGYITLDGISYTFHPQDFASLSDQAQKISWSRISFRDLGLLRKAVVTLDETPDVYWYEDVQQYTYSGFCMINVNGLPWNTNLDSLYQVVNEKVAERTRSKDFYLQKYFHIYQGDQLFVRYVVNCEEYLAQRLEGKLTLDWRSHLHNRDSVWILAIGIDQKKYHSLMRE